VGHRAAETIRQLPNHPLRNEKKEPGVSRALSLLLKNC
jgi:hypothetical protein